MLHEFYRNIFFLRAVRLAAAQPGVFSIHGICNFIHEDGWHGGLNSFCVRPVCKTLNKIYTPPTPVLGISDNVRGPIPIAIVRGEAKVGTTHVLNS